MKKALLAFLVSKKRMYSSEDYKRLFKILEGNESDFPTETQTTVIVTEADFQVKLDNKSMLPIIQAALKKTKVSCTMTDMLNSTKTLDIKVISNAKKCDIAITFIEQIGFSKRIIKRTEKKSTNVGPSLVPVCRKRLSTLTEEVLLEI